MLVMSIYCDNLFIYVKLILDFNLKHNFIRLAASVRRKYNLHGQSWMASKRFELDGQRILYSTNKNPSTRRYRNLSHPPSYKTYGNNDKFTGLLLRHRWLGCLRLFVCVFIVTMIAQSPAPRICEPVTMSWWVCVCECETWSTTYTWQPQQHVSAVPKLLKETTRKLVSCRSYALSCFPRIHRNSLWVNACSWRRFYHLPPIKSACSCHVWNVTYINKSRWLGSLYIISAVASTVQCKQFIPNLVVWWVSGFVSLYNIVAWSASLASLGQRQDGLECFGYAGLDILKQSTCFCNGLYLVKMFSYRNFNYYNNIPYFFYLCMVILP